MRNLLKKLFPSEELPVSATDETVTNVQDKIIFSLVVSFLFIFILSLIIWIFLGHTEKSEWLVYEVSSIAIFLLVAILGKSKKISNNFYFNKIIKLSPLIGLILFVIQIILLTFFFQVINYGYLALILVGLFPTFYFFKKNPKDPVLNLLVNGVLLLCVLGYFSEYFAYFEYFKIWEYAFVLVTWILLSLIIFALSKVKIPKVNKEIISVAVFLIVVFVAFNSTRKIIDYWNYSNILGPVYELSQGKSLLSDVVSMYGYLSIYFVKFVIQPFGITFENFHLFSTTLYFLFYLGFYFAYKKIFKDNLLTGLFSLVTTLINMRFYVTEVRGLPPSSGPMRFGFGLLIVLALLYLPQKINFWIISLLAAITVFWSPEVAIYVVPAFLFMLLVKVIIQGKRPKKILTLFITDLIPFAIFTAEIFLWIFFKEYGYHGTFPNFSDYFQFALMFKKGVYTELIPLFGDYYLAVLIMIIGLCLVFFQEWDIQKNRLLMPLSFLAIYNVAIFSYFVSESIPITINNISVFLLLELAIIFQYFRKNKLFWSRIFLPGTLFITMFATICLYNILGFVPRNDYEKDLNSNMKALADYQTIKNTYGLTSDNVLILSKHYDTLLVLSNQIKTPLPLNPSATTILIPNYLEKYIAPNLNKIKSGTIIVYTEDFPPEFYNFLDRNYIFFEINPKKRVGFFKIYNFRPR